MPTLLEKGTIDTTGLDAAKVNQYVAKDYVIERIKRKGEMSNVKHWADKVLILVAGTGTGKTVTIPPEVYFATKNTLRRNVVITQPRRLATIRVVQEDIVRIYPLVIGRDVGYQTRFITKKPAKGLIYATVGILLQQLKVYTHEELMRKYSVIIIDEAHERSLETDMTIAYLKSLLIENWENPLCPIVVFMSATLELKRFVNYWSEKSHKPEVITVSGRVYPITSIFPSGPVGNYLWRTYDILKEISTSDGSEDPKGSDILVFLHGTAIIDRLIGMINELNNEIENVMYPIKLTGEIYESGGKEFNDLEAPLKTLRVGKKIPCRKVIVSTNVAEPSVNIKTLKYVIDSGMRYAVDFDPVGFTIFIVKNVTKDSALQRKGRVGREAPGIWYPLYDNETYESFHDAKFPDIILRDVTSSLLSIISHYGKYDEKTFVNLMDEPSAESLRYAIEKLYLLGAIHLSNKEIIPSEIGNLMNKFRNVRIENIRMILAGYQFGGNILDLITIAVFSESKIKKRSYKLRQIFDTSEEHAVYLNDSFIDLIFMFDEFRDVVSGNNMKKAYKWCEENFISYMDMISAVDARDSLIEDMIGVVGFNPLYNGLGLRSDEYSLRKMLRSKSTKHIGYEEISKLKNCIYSGYKMNIARYDESYHYKNIKISRPKELIGTPMLFVFDTLTYSSRSNKMRYDTSNFSMLDNFVVHDQYF